MVRPARSGLTLLALLTASGLHATSGLTPLPTAKLTALKGQEALRAARVTQAVETSKFNLGLGALDGVKPAAPYTDAFGRTHVRFNQTYRGVEVWNGRLIGHVDADGNTLPTHATLQPKIDLAPAALLGEAKIKTLALNHLRQGALDEALARNEVPAQGARVNVKVQPIVFPTRFQGGVKFGRDAQGALVPDTNHSVFTPRKQAPYVWAYHVSTLQGLEATHLILDGQTGELLDQWDGAAHSDTPAIGTGKGRYCGDVNLNTLQLTDSTNDFTMVDTTRGTLAPRIGRDYGLPEFQGTGNQVWYYDKNAVDEFGSVRFGVPFTKGTNTWGNGLRYTHGVDEPGSETGETAGVDALYGVSATWDYQKNILGREGADNLGTSIVTIVHEATSFLGSGPWDIAQYMEGTDMMIIGDGGPEGYNMMLEVVAHEMAHGTMAYTANLPYWPWGYGEASGLCEGNSDIHAVMTKYYTWGAGGVGSVVPDITTAAPEGRNDVKSLWTYAHRGDSQAPANRRLYKPSLNGGYDAWFHGLSYDQANYVSGPGERAFFFLSQGAEPSGDFSSIFLPSGMTGLGNDRAIRIWSNAMLTKVTDVTTDYHAFRALMLESAAELFPGTGGADSPEVVAVKNAWAAVNVGAPAGGVEPVKIRMETPDQWVIYNNVIIVPTGIPAPLPPPIITGTTNTAVTWSLGGLGFNFPEGGKFLPDGKFVSMQGAVWPIKATSQADNRQFAVGMVVGVALDIDLDTEVDACDLIGEALTLESLGVYPNFVGGGLWLTAFNTAFAK